MAVKMLKKLMGDDLVSIVLFGSCAGGDFKADSDIDIAILTRNGRDADKCYGSDLVGIATEIAM